MENFSLNEIVWGKVRGYPWWPGAIIEFNDSKAAVHFIGENSQ